MPRPAAWPGSARDGKRKERKGCHKLRFYEISEDRDYDFGGLQKLIDVSDCDFDYVLRDVFF